MKFSLLASVFFFVRNSSARLTRRLMIAISSGAAAILLMHWLKLGLWSGYANENFVTETLLLCIPSVVALSFLYRSQASRLLSTLLFIGTLYYFLIVNPSKIEFLVLPGLASIGLVIMYWRRAKGAVVSATIILAATAIALVMWRWDSAGGFRESIFPRIALNLDTALLWLGSPLIGHGAGSFLHDFPSFQERHLAWFDIYSTLFATKQTIAGAAHNEYLQLLAELGLAGFSIALYFIWAVIRGFFLSRRHEAWHWAGLFSVLAGLLNAFIEFPLQNPATGLLFAVALGLVSQQAGTPVFSFEFSAGRAASVFFKTLLLMVIAGSGWIGWRFHQGQAAFTQTVLQLDQDPYSAFQWNRDAVRLMPWDFAARAQLYATLTHWMELNRNVSPLTPEENDAVFAASLTAGPQQQLLLARLQYLLNSDRYVERAAEVRQWLGVLRKNSAHTPDVWLVDAYYAVLTGDRSGAQSSLERAQKLQLDGTQWQIVYQLQGMLDNMTSAAIPAR